MSELRYLNVSVEQMALKAALDDNVELFEGIVQTAQADVSSLAVYTTHDSFMGTTKQRFLVYELVREGAITMLERMVREYDFSLRIKEDWEAGELRRREAFRARAEEDKLPIRFDNSGPLISSGYNCDSIVSFAKQVLQQIIEEEVHECARSLRGYADIAKELRERIGDEPIDAEAYAEYTGRKRDGPSVEEIARERRPDRRRVRAPLNPRFETMLELEDVERWQAIFRTKARKLKGRVRNIRHCLDFLEHELNQLTPA